MTQDSSKQRSPISQPARRAHALATFRWIEVRLMEMLAGWVPTTPEMEVKLLLGEHLYNLAQHADALGRRTRELRAPLHDSKQPVAGYVALLERVTATQVTEQRLAGFYGVVLPGLARRYRAYVDDTDAILDAPSIRIIEDILRDAARMVREYEALGKELPRFANRAGDREARLAEEDVALARLEVSSETSEDGRA